MRSKQCTEVRFASFLSSGFIIAIVVNPPERKLAKYTSVQCTLYSGTSDPKTFQISKSFFLKRYYTAGHIWLGQQKKHKNILDLGNTFSFCSHAPISKLRSGHFSHQNIFQFINIVLGSHEICSFHPK